jgi:hypothetical protein
MNKKVNTLEPFKLRTTGAAIQDGYRLFTANFRTIFRSTWLIAAVYALFASALMTLYVNLLPTVYFLRLVYAQHAEMAPSLINYYCVLAGTALLFSLVAAILTASGMSQLSHFTKTSAFPQSAHWYACFFKKAVLLRTLTAWGIMMVVVIVYSAVCFGGIWFGLSSYLSPFATKLALALMALLLVLILPPLAMWMVSYILNDAPTPSLRQSLFPTLYWGNAIIVSLIVAILTLLLTMIIDFPAFILFSANIQSQAGILQGDPANMPAYMTWMRIVVFALAGFILAFVHLSSLFPLYYLYGTTQEQEKERGKMKIEN